MYLDEIFGILPPCEEISGSRGAKKIHYAFFDLVYSQFAYRGDDVCHRLGSGEGIAIGYRISPDIDRNIGRG